MLSALVKLHPGYRSGTGGLPDQSGQVQNTFHGDDTWTEPTEDPEAVHSGVIQSAPSEPRHTHIFAPLVSAVGF